MLLPTQYYLDIQWLPLNRPGLRSHTDLPILRSGSYTVGESKITESYLRTIQWEKVKLQARKN